MTDLTAALPGKTRWETQQYQKDHGQRAAMALGLSLAGKFIRADEDSPLPPPFTICAPVVGGSARHRMDVVDAWAVAHHVAPDWNANRQTYEARMSFGPVSLMVYALLDGADDMDAAEAQPELVVA